MAAAETAGRLPTLATLRNAAAHCRECPLGALATQDGLRVLVTLHPSALLRGDPGERERAFGQWVGDLEVASAVLKAP